MKASDRSILLGIVILGLGACFWFMLLAPKRERASELETQVTALQGEVSTQEQLASAAEQAQSDYAKNYERLIVLGKAAPADGDTPSLLTQLTAAAERSRTEFSGLTREEAGELPAATPAAETTTDQNANAEAAPAATPVSSAPATEASAATLPLGASIGPAGLGVLPYTLQFSGDFFEVADLLATLDEQVGAKGGGAEVDGRLLTVNGFTLVPAEGESELAVELSITTYVLPDSQGLTAGATPAAPAPAVPPATSVPTSTPATP
jgi:hypothetical protein